MSALRKFYPISELHKENLHSKYNKNQSDIDCDVEILREWLKKQPHIPEIKDDEFLQILLLRNKYRVEKTKMKIDKYFSVRTAYPDIFLTADPCDRNITFVDSYIDECIMPKLCPDGSRIFYLSPKPLKSDGDFLFSPAFSYLVSRAENHIVLDYNDSVTMVFNAEHTTMSMATKVKIGDMIRGIEIFLDGYSGRISAGYAINMVPASEILYNMVKPMLPAKIKERIHVLQKGSTNKLFEKIPKDCLPIEIGGTGPSIEELSKEYSEATRLDRDYIMERNKNGTKEDKRIGEPTIDMAMYGVKGTFKKINID